MHENRETSGASRENRDRSGKANNHKPDRHDPEESDDAIVCAEQHVVQEREAEREAGQERSGSGTLFKLAQFGMKHTMAAQKGYLTPFSQCGSMEPGFPAHAPG